jgi:hypothetical protein
LALSASNSSCIAARQFGSESAARTEVGTGEMDEELVMAYFGFGLNTPARPRVTMG